MKDIALITGSYGGLGSCFVDIHGKRGGDMILVGRSQNKLDAQAEEASRKHHVEVHTIAVDLSKADAAQTIYGTCKEYGWLPDIIINNAGFGGQGDFARERTMEQDLSMIAVNVETPTRILKLFLKDMVERGSGKVLNVSSTAAMTPGPLQAVYYATKAYLTSFSDSLWRELRGTGVTVSCLMPGAMSTGFAGAGGLSDTALFAHATDPMPVAQAGYDAMLKGRMEVTAGLVGAQKVCFPMFPLMPKKLLMDNIYKMQIRGSAKK